MKAALLAFVAAVAVLAGGRVVGADEGDRVVVARQQALIGEQLTMSITVLTAPGATVEVDPAGAGWSGFEVVRIVSQATVVRAGRAEHTIDVLVAGFLPGEQTVSPSITVISGGETAQRSLPAVALTVIPTLKQDAPLELSALPEPVGIAGAESPLLRPALSAGVLAVLIAILGVGWWAARRAMRNWRNRPAPAGAPPAVPDLSHAASLLDDDPVGGYRALAATVRAVLGERYQLPAKALTTRELERRMQLAGVDRWQARLAGGLLEECDAVVYAGYRPAAERRSADLNMAREIVEPGEFDEPIEVAT